MYLRLLYIKGKFTVMIWHNDKANHNHRVAHRRLLPGPDQGTASDHRPLLQVCLAAIKRLSPSAIQPRRVHSNGRSIISEATIQDEIYCCLHYELHHLPILSEYAHSLSGRIDFYIYDKKWGVEILQNGNKSQVMEHMARFGPDGKYRSWNILDDYIVINFCFKSKLQKLRILGIDTHSIPSVLRMLTMNFRQRASISFPSGYNRS